MPDHSSSMNSDSEKGSKFVIFESFQLECVSNNKEYTNLFCTDPYAFYVLLNPMFVNEEKLKVLRRIVESEKPAHTVSKILLLEPWFNLGMYTLLGINTRLNIQPFIVGKSVIGRDTISSTSDGSGEIKNVLGNDQSKSNLNSLGENSDG